MIAELPLATCMHSKSSTSVDYHGDRENGDVHDVDNVYGDDDDGDDDDQENYGDSGPKMMKNN